MLKIKDVQGEDLEEISRLDLMDDDIEELKGIGLADIPNTLRESCRMSMSVICRCFYEDTTGEIIGVYGISCEGFIWFLSSKKLKECYREFLRGTKEEFKYLTQEHSYAYNYVHGNHKRAIRWLKWLGIHISEQIYTFPPSEEPYHKLEFIKE